MDKFGEMMQKMQKMSDAERASALDKVKPLCLCAKCITYNDCMGRRKEKLFCAAGESGCAPAKKGCICTACPVTPMLGLRHAFYCAIGSESEIRKR